MCVGVLRVTWQSFSLSFSFESHWHTLRKHSLHPPITSPSLFFSLCLSASLLLSLQLSLSVSLFSFLPAICLLLFHSWVKGLVETLRLLLLFFFSPRDPLLNAQSAERAQHLSRGEIQYGTASATLIPWIIFLSIYTPKSVLRLK